MANLLDLMKNPYKEYFYKNYKHRWNEKFDCLEILYDKNWISTRYNLSYYTDVKFEESDTVMSLQEIINNDDFDNNSRFVLIDSVLNILHENLNTDERLIVEYNYRIINKEPVSLNSILCVLSFCLSSKSLSNMLKKNIFINMNKY